LCELFLKEESEIICLMVVLLGGSEFGILETKSQIADTYEFPQGVSYFVELNAYVSHVAGHSETYQLTF
jgi:hypothetical protein